MATSRSQLSTLLLALAGLFAFRSPASAQILPLEVPRLAVPYDVTSRPGLAVHPTQGALVLYQRTGLAGQGNLRAQRFSPLGEPIASEIVVNDSNDATDSAVAYDGQGHFVAVWSANGQSILARRFHLGGTPDGSPTLLSPSVPGAQRTDLQIDCHAGGSCAIAWLEESGARLVLRLLDPAGAPVADPIAVVTFAGDGVVTGTHVAVAPDGTIAVLWLRSLSAGHGLSGSVPFVRFFSSQGQPLTNAVQIDPATNMGLSQRITGAWNDQGQLLAAWEIREESFPYPPTPNVGTRSRLLEVGDVPHNPLRMITPYGGWPSVAWCGESDRFVAVFSHVELLTGTPATISVQVLDAVGGIAGFPVPAGEAGAGARASLACDGHGMVWSTWIDPLFANSRSELRLLRLFPDEPTCQGPFIPLPGEIPCGLVGDDGRFVVYAAFRNEAGVSSYAQPISVSYDATFFAFYDADNPELAIKTVDGISLNGYLWFFYGALSDREFMISVYDRFTGLSRAYYNPLHKLASVGDTQAFPADVITLADAPASARSHTGTGTQGPSFVPRALSCPNDPEVLCLPAGDFRVTVHWRDFEGNEGDGTAVQLTSQSGWFWFFGPSNLELAVKVLDGRGVNGYFWVFYASLTNVEFTLRVLDEQNHLLKEYTNPSGGFASVADTAAF